jgi:asparagine synthase (glutamine-hydrolysing)
MCGIAGLWGDLARVPDAPSRLERMTAAIAHRGPDGRACWLGADVGLGHARLAIIDLAAGLQPMWDVSRTWVIIFNGEIYNYRELALELTGLGYHFQTRCDTEVIPAAIDAWGVDAGLMRLRGMFAFALYNVRTRRLLLARDRVGIKPLFYSTLAAGGLFASEPKALLASCLLSRRADPVALHDYLAQGYATTPATCWADIRQLEPGTWLEVGPGGTKTGRYWTWRVHEAQALSLPEAVATTEQTLARALEYHLISDVPVAAFLSGGLDSSLSVALLPEEHRHGLRTLCMRFADPAFDESAAARLVANHCGTIHEEVAMKDFRDDPELFGRVVENFDEPFGDSSCLPTYLVCRSMRQHVKVALSGDGGDEVFGGYQRYVTAARLAAAARLSAGGTFLDPVAKVVAQAFGNTGRKVEKGWLLARQPRAEMLLALHTYFTECERQELYQPDFAALALSSGYTAERFRQLLPDDVSDPLQQLLAAEFRLRLHADYLRKVDVTSSAHGLEVRVPYLDNALLDLAAQLPNRYKMNRRGETKIISRHLARKHLPRFVAERRKQGFSVPLDVWIGPNMTSFVHDTLLSPEGRVGSYLRPDVVRRVWDAFRSPRTAPAAGTLSRFQRYQRLFLLMSLELWLRKHDVSL